MSDIIRVAQIIGITGNGGVESVVMNYYRNIDRNRVQFDFFVESPSKIATYEEIEKLGGHLIITPSYKQPIKYLHEITRLLREGHYDFVHSNINTLSLLPLLAAKRAGIKVRILHNHSTWGKGELRRNLMKAALRPTAKLYANDYIACSRLAAEWMYGKGAVRKNKITICNNAVDFGKFAFSEESRAKLRQLWGWGDAPVFGHIGRFMTQKNHCFLLDVFAAIRTRLPEARFVLVGEGSLMDAMRKKATALCLDDCLTFVGCVPDPWTYYSAMDVFLLPSLYEGLPVVGVEAQVSNLPCLFSDKMTTEVLMTKYAEQVPLAHGAEEWADHAVRALTQNRERTVAPSVPDDFNIVKVAHRLTDHYCELAAKLRHPGQVPNRKPAGAKAPAEVAAGSAVAEEYAGETQNEFAKQ